MESLKSMCDREIIIHQQKMGFFSSSFQKSLESTKHTAQENVRNQGNIMHMKASLREAEDEFVKVLAVKTRNEAKQMETRELILATKARIDELKRTLQVERDRRDGYAAIMSRQYLELATSEGKVKQHSMHKAEIEEAISWYNKNLGFQIEGGHGVKFTFINISLKDPHKEYSFTIRHEHDIYTLLTCDPNLNDTNKLIQELNTTNGFFRFVRMMRDKFLEAAAHGGIRPQSAHCQDVTTMSVSAPVSPASTDRDETLAKHDGYQSQHVDCIRPSKGRKGVKPAALSPMSAASVRRSPRLRQRNEDKVGTPR